MINNFKKFQSPRAFDTFIFRNEKCSKFGESIWNFEETSNANHFDLQKQTRFVIRVFPVRYSDLFQSENRKSFRSCLIPFDLRRLITRTQLNPGEQVTLGACDQFVVYGDSEPPTSLMKFTSCDRVVIINQNLKGERRN